MTDQFDDDAIVPDGITHGSGLPDDGVGLGGSGGGADDLSALLGADGGLDFGSLMEQASAMQTQMLAAQQQVNETTVEGIAGGGAVRINVTGGLDFQGVTIDPSAVDPDDVDMLQDLVLAALRHAVEQINGLQQQAVDLGGLGGLGGLFGS